MVGMIRREISFVIDLPYLSASSLQASPYRETWLHLARHIADPILNCQVSILVPPTQSSESAGFEPFRGRLIQSCLGCPEGGQPASNRSRETWPSSGRPSSILQDLAAKMAVNLFGNTTIL